MIKFVLLDIMMILIWIKQESNTETPSFKHDVYTPLLVAFEWLWQKLTFAVHRCSRLFSLHVGVIMTRWFKSSTHVRRYGQCQNSAKDTWNLLRDAANYLTTLKPGKSSPFFNLLAKCHCYWRKSIKYMRKQNRKTSCVFHHEIERAKPKSF